MKRHSSRRSGLTLYEVVLSLVILVGSMTAMAELIGTGRRAAVQSELRTKAMLLCQSKLSEVVSGAESMQAVSGAPFDSMSQRWTWSLELSPAPRADLLALQVTVAHLADGNTADVTASLSRFIRNPQIFEQAASLAAVSDGPTNSEE